MSYLGEVLSQIAALKRPSDETAQRLRFRSVTDFAEAIDFDVSREPCA